jgi:hypothetical protein
VLVVRSQVEVLDVQPAGLVGCCSAEPQSQGGVSGHSTKPQFTTFSGDMLRESLDWQYRHEHLADPAAEVAAQAEAFGKLVARCCGQILVGVGPVTLGQAAEA